MFRRLIPILLLIIGLGLFHAGGQVSRVSATHDPTVCPGETYIADKCETGDCPHGRTRGGGGRGGIGKSQAICARRYIKPQCDTAKGYIVAPEGDKCCLDTTPKDYACDSTDRVDKAYCGDPKDWQVLILPGGGYGCSLTNPGKPVDVPWKISFADCGGTEGIKTAIGCVPTGDLEPFLTFLLRFALGISGGVVLLMVLSIGYTLITSQGNPEKIKGIQENVTALITGLILIFFSMVLLQAIGADILGLAPFK